MFENPKLLEVPLDFITSRRFGGQVFSPEIDV
jgi:hypothetical protein